MPGAQGAASRHGSPRGGRRSRGVGRWRQNRDEDGARARGRPRRYRRLSWSRRRRRRRRARGNGVSRGGSDARTHRPSRGGRRGRDRSDRQVQEDRPANRRVVARPVAARRGGRMRRASRCRPRVSMHTVNAEAPSARRVHRAPPCRCDPRGRHAPVVLAGSNRAGPARDCRGERGRRADPSPGGGGRLSARDHREARRRGPQGAVARCAPPKGGDGRGGRVVAGGVLGAETRREGGVATHRTRRDRR